MPTLVVEDGTGKANSNGYVAIADVTTYLDNHRTDSTAWTGATTDNQNRAIIQATQYLESRFRLRWKGEAVTETQALAWPRRFAEDENGFGIDDDVVPSDLQDACSELAFKAVSETLMPDISEPGTIRRELVRVGPITDETEYLGGKSQIKTFRLVDNLLSGLVVPSGFVQRS